jgi:uncharacterized membrane protein (GlpM family)
VRFIFGALVTTITGLIAKEFGPTIGGLFLAFPAIFPASATLIQKHEKEKKAKCGLHGGDRGRKATSVDAAGSSIGSIGLVIFGVICWKFLPDHRAPFVLASATLTWLVVAVLIWQVRKRV